MSIEVKWRDMAPHEVEVMEGMRRQLEGMVTAHLNAHPALVMQALSETLAQIIGAVSTKNQQSTADMLANTFAVIGQLTEDSLASIRANMAKRGALS